jgi:hypothetical protein
MRTRSLCAAHGLRRDHDRNRWVKTLADEALMRRGVVQLDECLVGLFNLMRQLFEAGSKKIRLAFITMSLVNWCYLLRLIFSYY